MPMTPNLKRIRERLAEIGADDRPHHLNDGDAWEFVGYTRELMAILDASKDHRRYATYCKVRDYLRPVYPDIFNAFEPLPLKLGIHHDLIKILDGDFSRTQIRAFLGIWCHRREYKAALRNATCRYDLTGQKHPLEAKDHQREAVEL